MRVPTGRLWVVEDDEPQEPFRAEEGPPSPGRFIRDQRLRRGMTLDEVAAATKIPRSSLEALEDERWSALPGPVFVKGFLRCYAKALELDEQIVLDLLYEQERARLHAEREPEPAAPARPSLADVRGGRVARRGKDAKDAKDATNPPTARDGEGRGSAPAPSVLLRDLLDRAGAIATRLPGANLLLWIAVGLLVIGLAFAVLLAFGSHQGALPQS
ncbi:MAG: helix-turn-helix domain-containing protein [Myxococcales bacterium]|nr:helix-turn-helix domain-containing protein [Myxococcales bacterium]